MQVYMEKPPGWSGGRRNEGQSVARALLWFPWEGMDEVGKFEQV